VAAIAVNVQPKPRCAVPPAAIEQHRDRRRTGDRQQPDRGVESQSRWRRLERAGQAAGQVDDRRHPQQQQREAVARVEQQRAAIDRRDRDRDQGAQPEQRDARDTRGIRLPGRKPDCRRHATGQDQRDQES